MTAGLSTGGVTNGGGMSLGGAQFNSGFPTPWRYANVVGATQNNMPNASNNYQVSTSGTAEDISQAITRAQFERYRDKIRPIERSTLSKLMSPGFAVKAGAEAFRTMAQTQAETQGMELRDLSRYQVQPTADQRAEILRHNRIENTLDKAGAYNKARQGVTELQTEGLANALQIGRGVAGQAMESGANAAGLQSARNQAQRQYEAAQESQMWNTVGAGAGLLLALGYL